MCAFEIDSKKGNQLSAGSNFGSVQAMQKKQEDADAKKAEEKSRFQMDTVSISEAAINRQLGRVEDNAEEESTDNASLGSLKEQVSKAEDAIDKINSTKGGKDGQGVIAVTRPSADEVEEEEKEDPLEEQIKELEEQIKEKEAEIRALMSDKSEKAQAKVMFLSAEIALLRVTLGELEAKQAESQQDLSGVQQAPGAKLTGKELEARDGK